MGVVLTQTARATTKFFPRNSQNYDFHENITPRKIPAIRYIYITTPRPSCKTRLARSRSPITRQMLSIVASGSDVVNGFTGGCERVVLDALPSCAVSAANLRCWLSESCLRRSSLSCAVSAANLRCWLSESCLRRCSPSCAVSAANLRCWLSESCLRRCSLSCAVSAANLRCWLSESCLRRCSLSCAVSAANLRCWRCRRS